MQYFRLKEFTLALSDNFLQSICTGKPLPFWCSGFPGSPDYPFLLQNNPVGQGTATVFAQRPVRKFRPVLSQLNPPYPFTTY